MSEAPQQSMPAGPAAAAVGAPVLEAVHLHKVFPLRRGIFGPPRSVKAVADVSLALYPGKVLALVGESGSGKTTVARLLARMYAQTSGTIQFRGAPVRGMSTRALRAYWREVQLVFQDPFGSLNPVHNVHYTLARPLRIYGHAHGEDEVRAQVLALLERVSLTPASQFIEKFPHELSGGQRQRIAIARTLAARPSVLLADEPVSMLDVSIRLGILNLLQQLKDEDRLALLYITHDIASARYFADETRVMYAGQLVEGGPSEALTQDPKHPYTQLLLSAAPDPDRLAAARAAPESAGGARGANRAAGPAALGAARGEPPSLVNPPSGCRFHPRCPHAMPVCREHFPARTDFGNGHFTHCFLYSGAVTGTSTLASPSPTTTTTSQLETTT